MSQPIQQKYKVIKKLDAGGMAEVFIADASGVEGIIKRVAIKRILPSLSANTKFVAMFLDEGTEGDRLVVIGRATSQRSNLFV